MFVVGILRLDSRTYVCGCGCSCTDNMYCITGMRMCGRFSKILYTFSPYVRMYAHTYDVYGTLYITYVSSSVLVYSSFSILLVRYV